MKTLKTKANSLKKWVNKDDIINHLAYYGINLEKIEFNIIENHREAFGIEQFQIIEIPENFYNANIKAIDKYKNI